MTAGVTDRVEGRPDPRIAARRQRVADDRRYRVRRRVALVLLVVSVVGLAWYVVHTPVVDVDEIVVTGAEDPARRAEVLTAAGIVAGDPLVFVSLGSVERNVAAVPWVDTVVVSRSWNPGRVDIAVTARTAVGAVRDAEQWRLVDSSGRAITDALDPGGLVVISGVSAPPMGQRIESVDQSLVAVAAALTKGLATRVAEVRPGAGGNVELVLRGSEVAGAVVVLGQPGDLGPAEIASKVRSLANVLATVDLSCLATIDLRVSDTAVLTRGESCA